MKNDDHIVLVNNEEKPDNICEECKKEDKEKENDWTCGFISSVR